MIIQYGKVSEKCFKNIPFRNDNMLHTSVLHELYLHGNFCKTALCRSKWEIIWKDMPPYPSIISVIMICMALAGQIHFFTFSSLFCVTCANPNGERECVISRLIMNDLDRDLECCVYV